MYTTKSCHLVLVWVPVLIATVMGSRLSDHWSLLSWEVVWAITDRYCHGMSYIIYIYIYIYVYISFSLYIYISLVLCVLRMYPMTVSENLGCPSVVPRSSTSSGGGTSTAEHEMLQAVERIISKAQSASSQSQFCSGCIGLRSCVPPSARCPYLGRSLTWAKTLFGKHHEWDNSRNKAMSDHWSLLLLLEKHMYK